VGCLKKQFLAKNRTKKSYHKTRKFLISPSEKQSQVTQLPGSLRLKTKQRFTAYLLHTLLRIFFFSLFVFCASLLLFPLQKKKLINSLITFKNKMMFASSSSQYTASHARGVKLVFAAKKTTTTPRRKRRRGRARGAFRASSSSSDGEKNGLETFLTSTEDDDDDERRNFGGKASCSSSSSSFSPLLLSLLVVFAGGVTTAQPSFASIEDSRKQVVLDIERRLELERQESINNNDIDKEKREPRPRWETKAEERAMMMREYDRLAIQQKEEKEEFNRKATAVYARQAAERKTLARIEKDGNPDGLSQSEKEQVAKEEGERAYEMTMNAIDASELELKAYNERMEERRRTALERNREELEKLEKMERKEKEESEILEQISKNCEKSLEDVNPFDDTVCI